MLPQPPMKADSWGVKHGGRHCIESVTPVIETGVSYGSYTLASLSVGKLAPNVLDFKLVLLLVLVLELLMPSTGSFSVGTNLVSVHVKENERKQELLGL